MKKRKRLIGLLAQYIELLPIVVVIVVTTQMQVKTVEVCAHALFAVATMSMVHCVNCCREMFSQCFKCCEIADALSRSSRPADHFRKIQNESREVLVTYVVSTVVNATAWISAATFYASALHDEQISWQLIASTLACFLLSVWKAWAATTERRELSIEGIAFALAPPGEGEPLGQVPATTS